jgi:hypothetical protein
VVGLSRSVPAATKVLDEPKESVIMHHDNFCLRRREPEAAHTCLYERHVFARGSHGRYGMANHENALGAYNCSNKFYL